MINKNDNNKYSKAFIKIINKIKGKKILIELLKRFENKESIDNLFKIYKNGDEIEALLNKLFNKIDKNEIKKIINKKIKHIDEEKEIFKKKIQRAEKLLKFLKDYHIIDIVLKNIKNNGVLTNILTNVKDGEKIGPLLQEMTDKKSIDVLLDVIEKTKKNDYQLSENFSFSDLNPLNLAKKLLRAIPGFNHIENLINGLVDIMTKLPQLIMNVLTYVIPAILKILPYIFDLFNYITTTLYNRIQHIGEYIKKIVTNVLKYPLPTVLSTLFFFIGAKLGIKHGIGLDVIPFIGLLIFTVICVIDLLLNDYYNVTITNDNGSKETIHIFKYIELVIESIFKYIFGGGFNIKGIINYITENKITTIIMIIASLIFIKSFITNISEYLIDN